MSQFPGQQKELQVNISIGDFAPLLRGPAYLFRGLQDTGVHGIELWVGVKSRWSAEYYRRLATSYGLPIVSLHQPLWAMTGLYFDEGFFALAQRLGVRHVTCHPLPGISLRDERMHAYFQHLSGMQERMGISILIENMACTYRNGLLHYFFPPASDTSDVLLVCEIANEYGLKMTLDTDHAHVPAPHKEAWFGTVLPKVGNIHLSSFAGSSRHLPLYMGDLKVREFMRYLHEHHYAGSITLELGWPKSITARSYNFEAVIKSIEVLRKAWSDIEHNGGT